MKDFYFSNEDDEKDFLKNRKWLIHSLIIEAIKKSIDEGLESIVVFRIINPVSNFIMTTEIKKSDWITSLEKSLKYYESEEEYEKCKEISDLILSIKNENGGNRRRKK